MPDGAVHTHGWVLGVDGFSRSPPTVVPQSGVLHAATLGHDYSAKFPWNRPPSYIEIDGGNGNVIRQQQAWFTRGTQRLGPAMAS